MFYNNPNPYNSYPYTIYNNQPQQPQYQQNMYQQQPVQSQGQQQVQQPQPNQMQSQPMQQIPFLVVNSRDEAEKFILNMNQTIYFKDSKIPDLIYVKTCDSQGIVKFQPKRMVDENINNNIEEKNSKKDEPKINLDEYIKKEDIASYLSSYLSNFNFIKKDDLSGYMTLDDLTKMDIKIDNGLDRLSKQIDKLARINSNTNNNNKKFNVNKDGE